MSKIVEKKGMDKLLEVEKELQIGVFLDEVEQVVLDKQLTDFAKMIYLHLKLQEKRMAVQELKLKREMVHRFGLDELKFYDGLNELIKSGWIGFRKVMINDDEIIYVYYVKENQLEKTIKSTIFPPIKVESKKAPQSTKHEIYKRMDLLTEEDRMAYDNLINTELL